MAIVLAFRLAARLAGGPSVRQWTAGAVAAGALLLTPEWFRYLIHGNEVPLAIALALAAVDRHLDGSRRAAFMLGAVVCLARPELFGFLLLYGAYLWWTEPATRALVGATAVLVVAAWLVPSWIGAGDPFYAGNQARSEPSWSLSLAPVPWRAALSVAQHQSLLVVELLALRGGGRRPGAAAGRIARARAPGRGGGPRRLRAHHGGPLRRDDGGGVLRERPLRASRGGGDRGARRGGGGAGRGAGGEGGGRSPPGRWPQRSRAPSCCLP